MTTSAPKVCTVCMYPVDHEPVWRAQAAVEPPLSDDELVAVRQLIEERFPLCAGGWDSLKAENLPPCPDCGDPIKPGQWIRSDGSHHYCPPANQSSRAEGTQHADAPREASSEPLAKPSLGISVSHEDLAAHIAASKWGGQRLDFFWADHIASELLADFVITTK
jgi:hypothetical protein